MRNRTVRRTVDFLVRPAQFDVARVMVDDLGVCWARSVGGGVSAR